MFTHGLAHRLHGGGGPGGANPHDDGPPYELEKPVRMSPPNLSPISIDDEHDTWISNCWVLPVPSLRVQMTDALLRFVMVTTVPEMDPVPPDEHEMEALVGGAARVSPEMMCFSGLLVPAMILIAAPPT